MAYAARMRNLFSFLIAASLCVVTIEANAKAFDAKQLARYDASYVTCSAQYPDMKGHGDEAYLSLWRMKPDTRTRALLAKTRGSPAYVAEKARATGTAKPTSAAASSPLGRECVGLWAEYQRHVQEKH